MVNFYNKLSVFQRVKDYLGRRFLVQYGAPVYWKRPKEDIELFGNDSQYLKDGSGYEFARVARAYPFMEFDTSVYTRMNFTPPNEIPRGAQEPVMQYDANNHQPPHFPMAHWMRDETLLKKRMTNFTKYGYLANGFSREHTKYKDDYVYYGIDSDYMYFHD